MKEKDISSLPKFNQQLLFSQVLSHLSDSPQPRIYYSLSEVNDFSKGVLEKRDHVREAFALMSLAKYSHYYDVTKKDSEKIEKMFTSILNSLPEEGTDKIARAYFHLYLLQASFFLGESRTTPAVLLLLKDSLFSLENPFAQPLLANKVIVFFERFKSVLDLNDLEPLVNNMKSVMLYLISSDLSYRFPFFQFAEMLIWSKGLSAFEKVTTYIKERESAEQLFRISSSGLAYVLEAKARALGIFDDILYKNISRSLLSKDKNYFTNREVPYGLYLNTPYENIVCLDTNVHLLLATINMKEYESEH